MRRFFHMRAAVVWLLLAAAAPAHAAGRLEVSGGWIRTPPPNAMMLAAYATVRNTGDAPVIFSGATSADFGDVSLHETIEQNGLERMRALGRIVLGPGETLTLVPGGRHLMLMKPIRALREGDTVDIRFLTESSGSITAKFVVREEAPPPR
jgi:periplasmic copper chaperone A